MTDRLVKAERGSHINSQLNQDFAQHVRISIPGTRNH